MVMHMRTLLGISLFFYCAHAFGATQPLPELTALHQKIISTNPSFCHNAINDLDYVTVKYWGFDNQEHDGVLLVHKELSKDIEAIFNELFKHRFPIHKIASPYNPPLSDEASMNQNLTIAFSCREVTGQPGILSQHSYGRAIDINPLLNPYVKGDLILPAAAKAHIERNSAHKGKITRDSLIFKLFSERGWDWGGNWHNLKDYQHFEKRANGELRNPRGYGKTAPTKN
jgi:hypothetical protein